MEEITFSEGTELMKVIEDLCSKKYQKRDMKFANDIIQLSVVVGDFLKSKGITLEELKIFAKHNNIELTYEPIPGSNGKYVLFTKQREQK